MAESITGVIDTVYTRPLGSVLSADATMGDMTVFVEDASDFDDNQGGTLATGGIQYGYTVADPVGGELTLDSALAADGSSGDRVDLWDTDDAAPATELRAHVTEPGQQASSDFIDAAVAQPLASQIAEGIRTLGRGESVRLEEHGDEWEIVNVRTGQPKINPAAAPPVVVARGAFHTASPAVFGTFGRIEFSGPASDNNSPVGDIATYATVNGSGDVELLAAGSFQASVTWLLQLGPASTPFDLSLNLGIGDSSPPNGYDVGKTSDASGDMTLYACSLPFYNDGTTGNAVRAFIQDASPITGDVWSATLHLVKLSD